MRLRAAHFACVLLLLSTFGATEASALRDGGTTMRGHYVGMLLQHGTAAVASEPAFPSGTFAALKASLPVQSRAQSQMVWAVRSPLAQSATMHAVTGFGR